MRRPLAIILILVMLTPTAAFAQAADPNPQASSAESFNRGVMAAEDEHSALGWGVGGFVAGTLFSWLGTGITVRAASAAQ